MLEYIYCINYDCQRLFKIIPTNDQGFAEDYHFVQEYCDVCRNKLGVVKHANRPDGRDADTPAEE